MPELPDLESYLVAQRQKIQDRDIRQILIRSPFVLRSFDPIIDVAVGRVVKDIFRAGKRLVWDLGDELYLVFHLMIAGRFHWKKGVYAARGKNDLAAFVFDQGTLALTEASPKKRASLMLVRGRQALREQDRGGLEPLECTFQEFCERLDRENHTLKRTLADPRLFSGIGNAYSDEILLAAKLSPLLWTSRLNAEQRSDLFVAMQSVLTTWRERLCAEAERKFPEKVTAFRPEMAVHGKFGQPCPVCGTSVQRITYAENECNYCPRCQTQGKLLADRSLSQLLKDDWPRTIDEWEERRKA
jgi:formamidopyrimidine-DNA glycosylase